METAMNVVSIGGWLLGSLACYKVTRRNSDENTPFVDAVCSLNFWPLILVVVTSMLSYHVGLYHAKQYAEWLERRKHKPALRAGADNGLYD